MIAFLSIDLLLTQLKLIETKWGEEEEEMFLDEWIIIVTCFDLCQSENGSTT